MNCRGVWILNLNGEVIASGVQADEGIVERLSQEARKVSDNGLSSLEFCAGGHQWIKLYPIHSPRFSGIIAVWEDRQPDEDLRLEVQSMAHDINNLLAVTEGHLELLQMATEHVPASLNEAVWTLARAEDLVRRLGQLSGSPVRDEPSVTAVNETLMHLTALLQNSRHRIQWDAAGDDPVVRLSGSDFIEIFQNLLQNACDAMPDGGLINIQVDRAGDDVVISVRDHGYGIESRQMAAIFAPHFTTKETGHGLGLYRTRQLVEQYGGRIRVVSTPGSGSCFIVTLPGGSNFDKISSSRSEGLH